MSDLVELLAGIERELVAPGGPFEMVVADDRVRLFRDRQPHLAAVWRTAVDRHADADALTHAGRRWTYRELGEVALRVAAVLTGRGIRPGDRVGIAAANCAEWVVGFWGCVEAGAVVVGLNGWWTGDELVDAAVRTGCRLVLCDQQRAARAAASLRTADVDVLTTGAELDEALSIADPSLAIRAEPAESDPALILFTSGTTGRAKGVPNSHRAMVQFIQHGAFRGVALMRAFGIEPTAPRPQQRVMVSPPFFHVSGCHAGIVLNHATGGCVVLPADNRAETLLDTIQRERPNAWTAVPTLVWRVVEHPRAAEWDTSSLTRVGYGGAPSGPELHDAISRVLPTAAAGVGSGYGLTETAGSVTSATGPDWLARPDSVGKPLPGFDVRLVDGEIQVRGAQVMDGYWDDAGATAEVITDGWFRTGDVGHVGGDGYLYVTDRAKDVIMRGGENIASAEVEKRLEAHPDVVDAAVVAVPHAVLGEEVKAVVHLRTGAAVSDDDLARWVGDSLSPFKVPAHWERRAEPLPRTPAGKLRKTELRSPGPTS